MAKQSILVKGIACPDFETYGTGNEQVWASGITEGRGRV